MVLSWGSPSQQLDCRGVLLVNQCEQFLSPCLSRSVCRGVSPRHQAFGGEAPAYRIGNNH